MTVNNNEESFAEKLLYTVNPDFPKLILDEILKQCQSLNFEKSRTGAGFTSKRSSNQYWLCWDTWIAGIMHNIFISSNNDYFHYDLDHFDSGIQATRYETNQYYKWHVDQGRSPDDRLPRKLSMTLLLNDSFSGGEFQIYNPIIQEEKTVPMKAGEIVIFPSWIVHRVKPVKSGTRYSLVAWMNGPQFK